jgi:hypothetical protein
MKNLFCLFFLLFNGSVNAQFAELIKDKNVAWVGEFSTVVRFDMLSDFDYTEMKEKTTYQVEGGLRILKFQDNYGLEDEGFWVFSHKLFNAAVRKEIEVYSDSLCQHPTEFYPTVAGKNDTVETIDPTTYETVYRVPSCPGSIRKVNVFRVHQVIYYNEKTNKWAIKVVSIAPLRMVKTKKRVFMHWGPLFWIKVDNEKEDINAPDITWAVHTFGRSPENVLHIDSVKILKITSANMPMFHFLDAIKNNKKLAIYDSNGEYEKDPMSVEQKANVFNSTKANTEFDSVTNQLKTKEVKKTLDFNRVKKMHFLQEWTWNDKRKALSVRLLSIAPMESINYESDDGTYYMPLFYQRFDD